MVSARALSSLSPTRPTEGSMAAFKPLGIFDRDVLHTAVAVVDEAAAADRPALVPGLLQRVRHEAGVSRARDTPARACPRAGEARPVGCARQKRR